MFRKKRRKRTPILDLWTIAFMPGVGFSKLGWRGSAQDSLKVEVLFLVLRSGKLLRCLRDNLSDGRLGGAATAILTGRWEGTRVFCVNLCVYVSHRLLPGSTSIMRISENGGSEPKEQSDEPVFVRTFNDTSEA